MHSRLFFGIVLIATLTYIATWYGGSDYYKPIDISAFNLEKSETSPIATSAQLKATFRKIVHLYPEEKNIPIKIFRKNYDSIGPDIMLQVLDERPLCHSEAHSLGRVIYEHNKDLGAATLICQNKCSAGCIHGVLLGFIASEQKEGSNKTDDPRADDLTPKLRNDIMHMCERSEITQYTGLGNCYHSMGHLIAFLTNDDIEQSLALCRIFDEKGKGAVYYCATGVYMQRSLDWRKHDEQLTSTRLYPCDVSDFPAACYRYKLRQTHPVHEDPESVAQMCLSMNEPNRSGCFHGLGFGGYQIAMDNPAKLNTLCGAGTEADKRMCLEGTLGVINVYEPTALTTICDSYTAGSRVLCEESRVGNFSMRRDFDRYLITRAR